MGIKRYKVLLDQAAAGNGDWVRLDTRYEEDPGRPIQLDIVSGDTITIQGITKDIRGEGDPTDNLDSDDIVDLDDFTSSGSTILNGNWTYIRVKKTGTNGNAKISGFV